MQPQQNPNDRPWTTCADCNRVLFVGDEDKDGRCPECGDKARATRPVTAGAPKATEDS